MLPFLAPLALKLSPVGAMLKRIPRWAWIALAAVAILLLGSCVHKRKVKAFGEERYAAGVAYEQARIEKKAKELKAKVDALSGKITTQLRTKHDEKVVVITRAADDLRMRGPGKASCPGYSGIPSGSGRPDAAGRRPDASPSGLPEQDRIALPFAWAVDNAERCDLNRAEVLTWREWHKQQTEAWAKIK
jgi:hypothetical protein